MLVSLACLFITQTPSHRFDFKDPKQISAVSLKIDSVMEPIVGYAKGISGVIDFDPSNPAKTTGKIYVDVSSVQFSNDGYTATARNYALNQTKFPQLELEIVKVLGGKKTSPTQFEGDVLANFTCRGITKPKRLRIKANYLAGKAEKRTNGNFKGDLLVVRTEFDVNRTEHGISQGIPADLVSETIHVGVAVVGICYAGETKK